MTNAAPQHTSTRALVLASNLSLEARTAGVQTYGLIARKGGGKTYLAGKLVELMHEAGIPCIVLDPVGVWWGLLLEAGGSGRGLQIPVLGGRHAQLPLPTDDDKIERLAAWLIEHHSSAVLDLSELRKNERKRFVTQFCEALFHCAKGSRKPRMVVLEEAQAFVPQMTKGQERMVGAIEDIVRLGRNYGLGAMMLTQRPQSVNKEVLNQVECLMVGQLVGSHERKAIKEWIATKADDVEAVAAAYDELPYLKPGDFWCWSPQWLETFIKIRAHAKRTYDASATPELGENEPATPAELPAVDLAGLQALLDDDEPPAGEGDTSPPAPSDTSRVDVDAMAHALATARSDCEALGDTLAEQGRRHDERINELRRKLDNALATVRVVATEAGNAIEHLTDLLGQMEVVTADDMESRWGVSRPVIHLPTNGAAPVVVKVTKAPSPPPDPAPKPSAIVGPDGELGRCAAATLAVLRERRHLPRIHLAIVAGYSHQGGGFRNSLSELRTLGLIEGSGIVKITPAGVRRGAKLPAPRKGKAVVEYWYGQVGGMARRMLQALATRVGPKYVCSREHLAKLIGTPEEPAAVTGGGFRNSLSELRVLGLIVTPGKLVSLSDALAHELSLRA